MWFGVKTKREIALCFPKAVFKILEHTALNECVMSAEKR